MSDEKKLSLDELEEILDNEQESAFSIRNIYAMVILNWQWILLSLIIFIVVHLFICVMLLLSIRRLLKCLLRMTKAVAAVRTRLCRT